MNFPMHKSSFQRTSDAKYLGVNVPQTIGVLRKKKDCIDD
jgi:hypothetical protein